MGIKAIFDSADAIPEPLREFYEEADGGKYVLAVEDIDSHPKVRGVVTANRENARKRDELKQRLTEAQERLAGLPDDFDPEAWDRVKNLRDVSWPDGFDPADPQSWEKIRNAKPDPDILNRIQQKHEQMLQQEREKAAEKERALAEKLNEARSYIDRTVRTEALREAMRKVGVDPAHEPILLDHHMKAVKVERDEDSGERRAVVESDLGPQSVEEFLTDWAKVKGKPYLAKGAGPDAPGSSGRGAGGKTMTRADFSRLDPTARQEAMSRGVTLVD